MTDPSRRQALQIGLAVAASVPLMGASAAEARPGRPPAEIAPVRLDPAAQADDAHGPPPLRWFAPFAVGDDLGFGWRLGAVHAPRFGAVVVELVRAAECVRVHVCRRGAVPVGVAGTDHLDFLVMNGGGGASPSDEELARVVRRLAVTAAGTGAGAPGDPVAPFLLPHAERLALWDGVGTEALG